MLARKNLHILLRYVKHTDIEGIPKNKVKPQECLIKMFTCGDTIGANLFFELLDMQKSLDFNLSGMIHQSHRQSLSGVKSFIIKECSTVLYIWCCSHRFALVVEIQTYVLK